ncbi:MAG: UbiA-like polyprenyltransferase [bacterium]
MHYCIYELTIYFHKKGVTKILKMLWEKIKTILELIKIEHSIFALPYAYAGAFFAEHRVPSFNKLFWITLAMISARTTGMLFNRLIDRFIDAKNSRTCQRIFLFTKITPFQVKIIIVISIFLLLFSAFKLNLLCFYLCPLSIILLWSYSYFKRFSSLSHIFLGIVESCAPIGGWIAITGKFALPPFILGSVIIFWIAGMDIIYSTLDYEFDKKNFLFSLPAKLGIKKSLKISGLFHFFCLFLLGLFIYLLDLKIFKISLFFIAGLLIYEHFLARKQKIESINKSFFAINAFISMIIFLFSLLEVIEK